MRSIRRSPSLSPLVLVAVLPNLLILGLWISTSLAIAVPSTADVARADGARAVIARAVIARAVIARAVVAIFFLT